MSHDATPDAAATPPACHATPAALFGYLDRLGIAHSTVTHPAAFTVAESRDLHESIPGAHSKNLFVKDKKGAVFLITALQDTQIDLKSLHRVLGASGRLSFGSPERLLALLGVTPGSVTPFAVMNDTGRQVSVILDAALMARPLLNFHPLINTMTTAVARDDLLRFLEAAGHPPRIVALSGPATES